MNALRPPKSETFTLLRFLAIGGAFSLSYSVITAALINFVNTPPFWTSTIVYALCVPLAFVAQKRFAFRVEALRKHAFLFYAATQVLGIALVAMVTTQFVTYNLTLDTALMVLTVGLTAVLNFVIGRFLVFKPPA